jgi:hypothetical protein
VSDETGRREVYFTSVARPAQDVVRVSSAGAGSPVWRHVGQELFFFGADNTVMSVTIKSLNPFQFGTPAVVFRNDLIVNDAFDVTHDGQRFVAVMGSAQTLTSPFTVVVHWTADLKR